MQTRIPIKNHQQEIQLIFRRSMWGLAIIFLLVGVLIFRLAFLQINKHEIYRTLSIKNWLDLIPVEPTRGLIFDRHGQLLAENIPVFSLDVIPFQINDLQKTLNGLKKIISLSDNDITQFEKQLKQHRHFDEIPLKLRLTDDEVARFSENQFLFPGIQVKARLMRHYPYGETFSHLLGYVGRINTQELNEIDTINYSASHYIGKLGVEKFYEEELHGQVGYQQVENDASGKPLRVLKEIKTTPGKNIYLTLDADLQLVAQKALGNHRGAIVAIEPATGQLLAMISQPGYDPNAFVVGMNQKDYQVLQQSADKPLFNRALRGIYPPASTIKPFLAIAGLEDGLITPEYTIYDTGAFKLHDHSHVYHDWVGHGTVDLNKAMKVSCNIYFYELGNRLGIRRMDEILKQFGFGNLTGLDLDDELPGVLASPEWKKKTKGLNWYEGDTVLSSIGQGNMRATPLQLAVATATLANHGLRNIPYLVLGEQLPGGAYAPQQPIPIPSIKLRNEENWNIVINAMQGVVNDPHGTATRLFGPNHAYTIAAKTGTGQIISRRGNPNELDKQEDLPERLRDHHLFIAFAPINQPRLALVVITENNSAAVAAARVIFDYYLGTRQNDSRSLQNAPQK